MSGALFPKGATDYLVRVFLEVLLTLQNSPHVGIGLGPRRQEIPARAATFSPSSAVRALFRCRSCLGQIEYPAFAGEADDHPASVQVIAGGPQRLQSHIRIRLRSPLRRLDQAYPVEVDSAIAEEAAQGVLRRGAPGTCIASM